ncbi:MAG: ribbon-helix-helix domain-containing protein [Nitrospira sp.]|nr:ribbon-helix-helix domain-containing protein [Nitrospira sp.]
MAKLVRIVIQLPVELKEKLDALKQQGYTTSGFIRATLERELNKLEVRQDPATRKAVTK